MLFGINRHDNPNHHAETAWDRILGILDVNDGYHTPQYLLIKDLSCYTAVAAFILGGKRHAITTAKRYRQVTLAKGFLTRHEFVRKIMDATVMGGLNGGLLSALKGYVVGTILGTCLVGVTEFSGRRGSVLDVSIAGALTGMLYRFQKGPRPMIGGGIHGACVGTVIGIASLATGANLSILYEITQKDIDIDKALHGDISRGELEAELLNVEINKKSK